MAGETPNTEAVLKEALQKSSTESALGRAIAGMVLYSNPYPLAPLLGQVLLGERTAEEYEAARDRLYARYDAYLDL